MRWPLILVLAGACTAKLDPGADAVRVTSNPEAVRGCTSLGEVKGQISGGGAFPGKQEQSAHNRLKNAALKLGANTVLLMSATQTFEGATQRGDAYRCPVGQAADSASNQQ